MQNNIGNDNVIEDAHNDSSNTSNGVSPTEGETTTSSSEEISPVDSQWTIPLPDDEDGDNAEDTPNTEMDEDDDEFEYDSDSERDWPSDD